MIRLFGNLLLMSKPAGSEKFMVLVTCELITENPGYFSVIFLCKPAQPIVGQIDDTCDVQTKMLCVWGGTGKAKVNVHIHRENYWMGVIG